MRTDAIAAAGTALAVAVLAWVLGGAGTPTADAQDPDEVEAPGALEQPGGEAEGARVRAELVAAGFAAPLLLTEPDDGTGRRFVVDQVGRIEIVDADGDVADAPFLDVSDRLVDLEADYDERGLLGLAFHPEYRDNGRFFVYYSAPARAGAPEGWDHTSHLSEFRVDPDDPDRADPASERIVLGIDEPYGNHNGGQIRFGADGMLYVPLGDGGNAGDRDDDEDLGRPARGNGQTPETLLGSVLRIDVDGEQPYAVPPDNPFVGRQGADEVWAYGFRNPYGLSVDRETGDLYVADAGQSLFEEVDRLEAGGNFGWNIREGTHCFDPEDFQDPPADCRETGYDGEPLIDSVLEYRRSPERGSVVVPGVVSRDPDLPALEGRFVFGDYSRVRFLPQGVLYEGTFPADGGPGQVREIRVANAVEGRADGDLDRFLLGVSQDREGDLYAMTSREGGPTGTSGAVLELRPEGDASGGGWGWRGWTLLAVGLVATGVTVAAVVAGRRSGARA